MFQKQQDIRDLNLESTTCNATGKAITRSLKIMMEQFCWFLKDEGSQLMNG